MRKKIRIILCVIIIVAVYLLFCLEMASSSHIIIQYAEVNTRVENDQFWGHIIADKIEITNKGSKEKYRISLPFVTDQFTLGSNYIYVLNRGDNIASTKAEIFRYTFAGELVDVWELDQVNQIYFSEGKLFFQYWMDEEQSYPYVIQNGMIVNAFVNEKEFGKQVEKLIADRNGRCKVGKQVFYLNSKGYFSTEREYSDYSGVSSRIWGKLEEINNLSDQERKNINVLKKKFGYDEDYIYERKEYQKGKYVYGVLIIWEMERRFKQNFTIPLKNIVKSHVYKIDLETEKLTVLEDFEKQCAVVSSENCCVYVEDDTLKKREYKTGIEKILYKFNKGEMFSLNLQDSYLRIVEGEEFRYIQWLK